MSTVLVTGGAGFLGSHTCRSLMDAGHQVVVLDAFHVYVLPIQASFLENMDYRFNHLLKGARVLRGSTLNKDDLRRVILEHRPERIVHFAALPLANVAVRQTEEAFQGILQGTVNVLEVLRDVSLVKRFVYVSSSMVYGDFRQVPVPEDAPKDPKDIYGAMKLAGEIITKAYARRYDIAYTIVRPSAVYGPTDNNRRVIQVFLENALAAKPIEVVKGPDMVMDFTYVKDVADGISRATFRETATNEEFNVTCGVGRNLFEVVELLRQMFPKLQVEQREEPTSFRPKRGALSIAKAQRLLDYRPQWLIDRGLVEYATFMRQTNLSILGHQTQDHT